MKINTNRILRLFTRGNLKTFYTVFIANILIVDDISTNLNVANAVLMTEFEEAIGAVKELLSESPARPDVLV
jgi:hypothetical protein